MFTPTYEPNGSEIAVIETDKGTIKFEFYSDDAPNHVASFVELAQSGFYDGTTFHRVEPGFVIQGGDPYTKTGEGPPGTGGPGYTVDAEFNSRQHLEGTVAMARAMDPELGRFAVLHLSCPPAESGRSVHGVRSGHRGHGCRASRSPSTTSWTLWSSRTRQSSHRGPRAWIRARFDEAKKEYDSGDFRSAAKGFLAAAGRETEGVGAAYHMAGNSLMRLRRYGDAVTVYGHALRDDLYDKRGSVRANLAAALVAQGDYALAIEEYQRRAGRARLHEALQGVPGSGGSAV